MSANRVFPIARRLYALLVLGLLMIAGLCLRIVYASSISLHVDEFISLLAIRAILQHGYPLLPSGTLYEQGLLFSYIEAPLLGIFGFSATVGRALSVAASLATIAVVYYAGSKLFSRHVGLVAAALTALSPESIAWGSRVRMYALLQLLVQLSIWFLWRGGTESKGARYRWAAILCYLGALFTHPVSVLLLVPLLLALVLLRGPRGMLKPASIPELLVPLCGILATLVLKAVGQPGQLEALAESRPYLAPSLNVMEGLRPIAPFFTNTERIPLTVLAALGLVLVIMLVLSARARASVGLDQRGLRAPLFLYTILGGTVLEMVFLVGPTWRDTRYLFMLEPIFFLIASWMATVAVHWVCRRVRHGMPSGWHDRLPERRVAWLATSLLVVAACLLVLPAARTTLARQEWGYDLAFEYLGQQWRDGDAVMTIVPYACQLYVPRCDYYVSGKGYEEYVFDRNGVLIDRWIGAPLLTSASQLESVLSENPRTWLVVDGWRLAARFDLDFVRTVAEQMGVVYEAQGVRVLLAEGRRPTAEPATGKPLAASFGEQIELVRYELSSDDALPGSDLHLTLYWQALRAVSEEYTVFVHLRGEDGATISQDDYPPLKNLYPTYYWSEDQVVPDPRVLSVPQGAAHGWYRLEVGLYDSRGGQRLPVVDQSGSQGGDFVVVDYIWVGEDSALKPSHQIGANLGNQVRLLGHDGVPRSTEAGQTVPLSLYWEGLTKMAEDYTVFVHLVDGDGGTAAQHDGQPLQGFYPTSFWDAGEIVRDEVGVSVGPSVPAGEYELVAGLYLPTRGERLPVLDEDGQAVGDTVSLGVITVAER
ncbi:MAG TPA: glycosyltransferase family 39 protein [Anaerolineae bacterium]|nr:glycosyltransferase family 39 protein [Anaerolineae bacterium]